LDRQKEGKLSTSGYKGTRDFYPEDMRLRNYIFHVMRKVVESYGYEEYDGPLIEALDLYRAKTGEEIVNRQLYNFIDKGGRQVAIRPEMTPTLARMVAARQRELPRPIRWFSFPNLWRYEQPGRGRLREHWQLNVDIFGVDGWEAELEILQIACDILFAFGADSSMFQVLISHRKILDSFFREVLGIPPDKAQVISRILDKKNKISREEYESEICKVLPEHLDAIQKIDSYLSASLDQLQGWKGISVDAILNLKELLKSLEALGLGRVVRFDPSIVRGFDYYTGFVYEIFDTSPENNRSLYGGGRYDNLTGLFSNESLSGTGFGLGDVTLVNFLTVHNLLPQLGRENVVCIPLLDPQFLLPILQIAQTLRKAGICTEILYNPSHKLGKQIQIAERKGIRFVLLLGERELESGMYSWKDLKTRTQVSLSKNSWLEEIQKAFQD